MLMVILNCLTTLNSINNYSGNFLKLLMRDHLEMISSKIECLSPKSNGDRYITPLKKDIEVESSLKDDKKVELSLKEDIQVESSLKADETGQLQEDKQSNFPNADDYLLERRKRRSGSNRRLFQSCILALGVQEAAERNHRPLARVQCVPCAQNLLHFAIQCVPCHTFLHVRSLLHSFIVTHT